VRLSLLFLLAATALAGAARAADWPADLSARSLWAENYSRTSDPRTAKDAAAHELTASTGLSRSLAAGWLATGDGAIAWETVPKFDGLDAWRFSLQGSLRRKFGLGPQRHPAAGGSPPRQTLHLELARGTRRRMDPLLRKACPL
jgi:hypothetical protein